MSLGTVTLQSGDEGRLHFVTGRQDDGRPDGPAQVQGKPVLGPSCHHHFPPVAASLCRQTTAQCQRDVLLLNATEVPRLDVAQVANPALHHFLCRSVISMDFKLLGNLQKIQEKEKPARCCARQHSSYKREGANP